MPPERSTSLFRCVDLCAEHGGIPACIDSEEENDFVTEELAAADGLWLGLYQVSGSGSRSGSGWGSGSGWDRCVARVMMLPALSTGARASRATTLLPLTIKSTNRTARISRPGTGGGILCRARAAMA